MSEAVTIVYCGETVSVPKEVADFLEQDQKREQAQIRQDTRHLSRSEFETELSSRESVKVPGVPWKMRCSGTSGLKICRKP